MKNDIRAIIALITTYVVGNFLLLLNKAIYWDTWIWLPIIKEGNYKILWDALYQSKRFTAYYLYRVSGFFDNPILFFKLAAFFSCLLAGILLYGILRKKISLCIDRAFFISAFFILTPVFLVRIDSSILQHSFNIMLFFLAAFIYFIAEKNKNRLIAIINYSLSWILFFLSFNTYSLLMFYGGFLLLSLVPYCRENLKQSLGSLVTCQLSHVIILWSWLKNNFIFIILPIIFWSLKLSVWKDTGAIADYDNFINPIASPSFTTLLLWETLIYGFFWQIIAPILILHRKIFALVFLTTGFATYLTTQKIFVPADANDANSQHQEIDYAPKYYLLAGIIMFFLGFLPYFLTGKMPHLLGNPFNMRSAFLLPLGSSLIILSAIILVIKKDWQYLIQKIILALFMTFTIYNYYGLDMDWYKQMAVIESIKNSQNENIENASTLVFDDQISSLNWSNRDIHGEEYLGYLEEIYDFRENPKFGTTKGEINYYHIQKNYVAKSYPDNFNPLKKVVNVSITTYDGPEIMTVGNWLKIKQLELFGNQKSFIEKINEIFRIKLEINP